jgi:DNA-binding GntR family transcriptional regulator
MQILGSARAPHATLAEESYAAIRLAMLHGQLKPGVCYSTSRLTHIDIAASRTPVREALQRLEAEGLVEILPQRGFRVTTLTREDYKEFYALRELLEGFVVETLCDTFNAQALQLLRQIVDRQRLFIDDLGVFLQLDEEFHASMATLADLPRTAHIISSLRGIIWLTGSKIIGTAARRQAVLVEHGDVVEALANQDRAAAVAAMAHHLRQTKLAVDAAV